MVEGRFTVLCPLMELNGIDELVKLWSEVTGMKILWH